MVLPTVTSLAPNYGLVGGGLTVTVTGTNLTGATAVLFDGVPGTNIVVGSSTSLTVVTPMVSQPQAAIVTVTTSGGTSLATSGSIFYFFAQLGSATYSTENPFFDPTANYVVAGQWDFLQQPLLQNLPVYSGAGGTNFSVVVDISTGRLFRGPAAL